MQQLKYDDREIRQVGIKALTRELGFSGAVRFLRQFAKGEGDYLKIQDRLFEAMHVEEIYTQAEKQHKKGKRNGGMVLWSH